MKLHIMCANGQDRPGHHPAAGRVKAIEIISHEASNHGITKEMTLSKHNI